VEAQVCSRLDAPPFTLWRELVSILKFVIQLMELLGVLPLFFALFLLQLLLLPPPVLLNLLCLVGWTKLCH